MFANSCQQEHLRLSEPEDLPADDFEIVSSLAVLGMLPRHFYRSVLFASPRTVPVSPSEVMVIWGLAELIKVSYPPLASLH